MDLSPKLLTDVQFREQWRGYKPEEVDEFLERVALGVGDLQQRLNEALERAAAAEHRLLDRSDEDEIRRTLVLAQRTADASVAEARAEAERLVSETEERCRALVADAEAQAAELEAEISTRRTTELGSLAAERATLEVDIDALRGYIESERGRLVSALAEQLDSLQRDYALRPPPAVSDVPPSPDEPVGDVQMRAPAPVDAPQHDVEEHDDLRSAREGLEEAMRRAGLDELIAEDPPESPELFDDRAGDITGEFDSLTEATAQPASDDGGEQLVWREPAEEDDPFLAELRRAVGDTEPLGPRDHHDAPTGFDIDDQDDASGGFLRRRRRG